MEGLEWVFEGGEEGEEIGEGVWGRGRGEENEMGGLFGGMDGRVVDGVEVVNVEV